RRVPEEPFSPASRVSSHVNDWFSVMPGLVPGIHVFGFAERKTWMAGHRRAEATPSYGRLCPAMTRISRQLDVPQTFAAAGAGLAAQQLGDDRGCGRIRMIDR